MDRELTRATAAMMVIDKDHFDFVKVRAVHSLWRPEGMSTNDEIDILQSSLPTVEDTFV